MGAAANFGPGRILNGVPELVADVLGSVSRFETWVVVIGFISRSEAVTSSATPPLGGSHAAQLAAVWFTRGRGTVAIGTSPSTRRCAAAHLATVGSQSRGDGVTSIGVTHTI